MSVQNDKNSHTGYTPLNLVNALLSVRARIANILSVGVHITLSHNVRNIQNIIKALDIDINRISAQIFLFSVLLMLEKKETKHIQDAINNPTKWKLKFWMLSIVANDENDFGIKFHVSRAKAA